MLQALGKLNSYSACAHSAIKKVVQELTAQSLVCHGLLLPFSLRLHFWPLLTHYSLLPPVRFFFPAELQLSVFYIPNKEHKKNKVVLVKMLQMSVALAPEALEVSPKDHHREPI